MASKKETLGAVGVKFAKKKLKIFKKSLKKSVDLLFELVLYYRCNQSRWFETQHFSYCKSTLTTTYFDNKYTKNE